MLRTSLVWRSLGAAVLAGGLSSLPAEDPKPAKSASAAPLSATKWMIQQYCVGCHNARLKTAGLMLDSADIDRVADHPDLWEKVTRKLRTGEMPPAGIPRPDAATYVKATTE